MQQATIDEPFNEDDYDLLPPDDTEGHVRWRARVQQDAPQAQQTAIRLLALLQAKGTGSFCLSDADKHSLGADFDALENDFEQLMRARLLAVHVRYMHPNEYVLVDHLLTM